MIASEPRAFHPDHFTFNMTTAPIAQPSAASQPAKKPVRNVLIAEDDTIYLDGIAICLRDAGWNVTRAVNGTIAMEKAVKYKFDLLVFDHKMPGIPGLDVVQKLQAAVIAQTPAADAATQIPPVIVITSYADAALQKRARDLGIARVISKPPNYDELPAIVEKVVARAIEARQAAAAGGQSGTAS